ncbi:MAG TPA: glycosyltransferase family 4 protein [Leptolyngbyaceae cyanobacterium M33_DOE_097]|uniref:Glycosyltransferase family 1 protein n=1 Tax=Oscillatoriales cyanobacterium SpSt-418 TaxID=2282169 RepID=A0A7C3KFR9_9CYAN|nr:glycosyltransferase family 4 protein [Leptolyngbyaceae cyanobacterium M33_DOE_097]
MENANSLLTLSKNSSDLISKKPGVLFVLGTLWGENGITSHLLTLSQELIKQGWRVGLVSKLASDVDGALEEATRSAKEFESCGVDFFPISSSNSYLFKKYQILLDLKRAISKFSPDIIHSHSLSVCPYLTLIKLFARIPCVSTCHVEPTLSNRAVKLGSQISSFTSPIWGDRLIAISTELKVAFQKTLMVPEKKIRLVHHGINHHHFRPPSLEERTNARNSYNLSSDDKVVCLIGRLAPSKGHDLLIKALGILKTKGVKANALLAGKAYGKEEVNLKALAIEQGVENQIRFLGKTDTRQVLWASDVSVLPSRSGSEGFALVIPESMLCGVLPIRTPAAGSKDQIEDGVNGFIIPFEDAEALAIKLENVLLNNDLKSKIATAALIKAQQSFTVERMVENTINVYQELVK